MEKLKKELNVFDVFSIACGAMISSGIFILPGLAFGKTGPSVFLSYFFAGVIALIGVFSIAELTTAMPKAGGDYFYITRTLGPLIGTISGILSWIAISLKTAFAIFGIAGVIHYFTGWDIFAVGIIVTLFFVFLNSIGIGLASRIDVIIFIIMLLLIFVYIFFGITKVSISHFEPFTYNGTNAIFSTVGFVFVSYGGLVKVAALSEEMKNPQKTLPLALISSVIFIGFLYALVMFVVVGTLTPEKLSSSFTPIADSASKFLGEPGYLLMIIAAMLAFITTAIAGMMSASRYPLALSRDFLFPKITAYISKRFHTPLISIYITGALIIGALFLELEMLAKAASAIMMTTYLLSSLAVIILRESKIQNYRPTFRVPLYPYVPIFTILVFGFLIVDLGLQAVEISLFFVAFAFFVYFFYGRRTEKKEYALLHLVARITSKEITGDHLEDELKNILHERDNVVLDRFDHLLKSASILDVEGPMALKDFFSVVADELALDIHLSSEETYKLLEKREKIGSTGITPFVAIPHIIIPGTKTFHLMVVRCCGGIFFSKENPKIKAIFFLLGSKDERNFHLQALASTAQIVQGKMFERRWVDARNTNNLRDILLLGERKRFLA
ncbi:MAG: amino acid permease [Candidatus Aceula meridiana]|nr:amino acid permease [Candidatus Aceula meridiana]